MSGEGSSRRPRRRPRDDSPPSVHCVCNSRYRNHTSSFRLRVFFEIGTHHTGDMFNPRRNKPRDEIHVHTWMDATLREITREVKDMVHRTASRKNAKFSFAIVSRNRNSNYEVRKVGEVLCYESSETETETEVLQDNLTLRDLGFCKDGDYLDVARGGSMPRARCAMAQGLLKSRASKKYLYSGSISKSGV